MAHKVVCFRCGESLAALSLPLSRQDECPNCRAHLHVCRMCEHYDPTVPKQCREDDAEDVVEKERLNFCDWFVASENTFDAARRQQELKAQQQLDALFGDGDAPDDDSPTSAAEDLFK